MSPLTKCLLLFVLNWLDAQLTILWVRGGWATEGNSLMASLLNAGNTPFLLTKLAVGAFVAYVFFRWYHLSLARRGLKIALGLYLALMFVHAATGLSALGSKLPETVVAYLAGLPHGILVLFS